MQPCVPPRKNLGKNGRHKILTENDRQRLKDRRHLRRTKRVAGPHKPGGKISQEERDRIVAKAREAWKEREQSYREQSLGIHPWVCARCGRHFTRKNLHELTVHHKDHNHDNNPPDGSNWENLCIYCHENEHRRYLDHLAADGVQVEGEKKRDGHPETFCQSQRLTQRQKKMKFSEQKKFADLLYIRPAAAMMSGTSSSFPMAMMCTP